MALSEVGLKGGISVFGAAISLVGLTMSFCLAGGFILTTMWLATALI
jgi:hypothetical protein